MKETYTDLFSWSSVSEGVLWVWKESGLSRLDSYKQWELFWTTMNSQVHSSSKSSTSLLATFHSKSCKQKGKFTGNRRGLWYADTYKRSWCYSAASVHHSFNKYYSLLGFHWSPARSKEVILFKTCMHNSASALSFLFFIIFFFSEGRKEGPDRHSQLHVDPRWVVSRYIYTDILTLRLRGPQILSASPNFNLLH